jgi:hypothetical protein
MTEIRRAFLWTTLGRYLVMTVNLAAAAVMARLPDEYGVSVLGGAVFAVAEAIRPLGGGAYLIQKKELTSDDVRSSFTVSLSVTIVLTAALMLLLGPLTRYFVTPDLGRYLRAAILGFLTGPFVYPISALMSRHQPLVARLGLPRHHHRLADGFMAAQQRVDLSEFDPEAADLHLMIEPAEMPQLPVGAPAPRSPVRYNRVPGCSDRESGMKRSAVSPGRPR